MCSQIELHRLKISLENMVLTSGFCFVGNDESGKSTLISKIRGKEDEISRGHGLEYTYLDVHDEELDGKFWEVP